MLNLFTRRVYNRVDGLVFYAMGLLIAMEWYWSALAVFVIGIPISATFEVRAANRRAADAEADRNG